jgi:ATP-dependent Clp endopeptidase proteolytic subunit ClpP
MSQSWFAMRAAERGDKTIAHITIYGDIGAWGVSANDFRAALDGLGIPDELRIHITSDGGDVTQGFAIYNLLAAYPAKKTIVVDALAASMASIILMAGDERIMPKNAMVMVHNPWGGVLGDGDEIINFGTALLDMQNAMVETYVDATGLSKKEIKSMMDKETWLTAAQAKKLGFATKVIEPRDLNAKAGRALASSKFFTNPAMAGLTKGVKVMAKAKAQADEGEFEDGATVSPAEIRAALLADQKEIRNLCALAGYPDLADSFIDEDKSAKDVAAALAAKKAADDEEEEDEDAEEGKPWEKSKKKKASAPGPKKGGKEVDTRRPAGGGASAPSVDTMSIFDKFNGRA